MEPVVAFYHEPDAQPVLFQGKDCDDLPGVVFPDGCCRFQFAFSDEDRAAIARGENLLLWIWKPLKQPLNPLQVTLTNEQQG